MIAGVHVYDLREHPDPERRQVVLRLLDESGSILVQGLVFGEHAQQLGQMLAERLGVELRFAGPPAKCESASGDVPAPAVSGRGSDYVTICPTCGHANGWLSAESTGFDETLGEWLEDGRPLRAVTTDEARTSTWCTCRRKAPKADQRSLF